MATARAAFEKCPYPDCCLAIDHDGNHEPRFRLVQRFSPTGMYPGSCESGNCVKAAVALYQYRGKSLMVCGFCEGRLLATRKAAIA